MFARERRLLAVNILFLVLTWLAVSLRVYSRAILLKKWGGDDSAMAVTLGLFTVSVACQIMSIVHGFGHHSWDITPQDSRTALFYCYVHEIFYVLSGVALKIALGLFHLRIAIERWHILVIKMIVIGTTAFGVASFFIVVFQCVPVSSFWLDFPSNDQCIPKSVVSGLNYTLSALNTCVDWILGTLPFFIVRSLNLSFVTKMLVAGILSFAAVGSTATIVRMTYISDYTRGPDFLYRVVNISIWSIVEPGIGITAGSIATLRPLLQNILWRLGYAPAPRYTATRPINSRETSLRQHRFGWFQNTHGARGIALIESSSSTATTPSPSNPKKKRWFSSGKLRTSEIEQDLASDRLQLPVPSV